VKLPTHAGGAHSIYVFIRWGKQKKNIKRYLRVADVLFQKKSKKSAYCKRFPERTSGLAMIIVSQSLTNR